MREDRREKEEGNRERETKAKRKTWKVDKSPSQKERKEEEGETIERASWRCQSESERGRKLSFSNACERERNAKQEEGETDGSRQIG